MKWITGLNIKDKTIKCLWRYILGDLCDTDSDKRFLDNTSKAEFIKKKIINWTLYKLNTFYLQKILLNRTTGHERGENIYK